MMMAVVVDLSEIGGKIQCFCGARDRDLERKTKRRSWSVLGEVGGDLIDVRGR